MADISFSCPKCGQVLEAPEDMAGQVAECPACGESMTVPAVEDAATGEAAGGEDADAGGGLTDGSEEAAGDSGAEAANECPSCHSPMEADAVLCLSCGYHLKLGRKITTAIE